MAAELRQRIQEERAVVRQRHLARHRHLAAADQAGIRDGRVGARHERVVTNALLSGAQA